MKKDKKMTKLLLTLVIALLPLSAKANCYQIQDNDLKNNCLAVETGQASYCYQIQNQDAKNYCLAKLYNRRSYCYQIMSSDQKNECLTFVK
jgi:hypothetical protein